MSTSNLAFDFFPNPYISPSSSTSGAGKKQTPPPLLYTHFRDPDWGGGILKSGTQRSQTKSFFVQNSNHTGFNFHFYLGNKCVVAVFFSCTQLLRGFSYPQQSCGQTVVTGIVPCFPPPVEVFHLNVRAYRVQIVFHRCAPNADLTADKREVMTSSYFA